ncbi:MAG: hypothetical protein RR868_05960, partial [Muribaculaceae bacterium]
KRKRVNQIYGWISCKFIHFLYLCPHEQGLLQATIKVISRIHHVANPLELHSKLYCKYLNYKSI